jgi:ABC-type transporter Mla subunit MlaD
MAESIQELVELGGKKAEEFRSLLGPAMERVAQLKELVEQSAAHLDVVAETTEGLKSFLSALGGLGDKIEGTRTDAASKMEAFEQLAQDTVETFSASLTELRSQIEEATTLAAASKEAMATRQSTIAESFEGVGSTVGELRDGCESEGSGSNDLAVALTEAVGVANEALEQLETTMTEGLDALQEACSGGVEQLLQGVNGWVESTVEGFGEASSAVEGAVSQSLEALQSKLVDEAGQRLGSTADEVLSGLGDAMDIVTDIGDKLDGSIGDVIAQLEQVVDLIEPIEPLLDKIQEALG